MRVKRYVRIADEHHVVRRCAYQVIERDSVTRAVIGLFPAAFRLRQEQNESYLSANWLEQCDGTKLQRLKIIVAIQRQKAKGNLSPQSGVAILNAGRIREIGVAQRRALAVRHTPNRDDPSYARVSGLPLDNSDDLLLANLAAEAYRDFRLLSDVDAER